MRHNTFFLFSLLCAVGLASCKPRTVRVERAVPVMIPADSAQIIVQADCPDGAVPIVRLIEAKSGRNLTPELTQKGDTIAFSAIQKADTVYRIVTVSGLPIEVPIVQTVYKLRWWQMALVRAGAAALIALLVILSPHLLKITKKLMKYGTYRIR